MMFSRSATTITPFRISHSTARLLAFLIVNDAFPAGTEIRFGSQPLSVIVMPTAAGAAGAASACPRAWPDRLAADASRSASTLTWGEYPEARQIVIVNGPCVRGG